MFSRKTRLSSLLFFSLLGLSALITTLNTESTYAAPSQINDPSLVARLSYMKGPSSFLPAGANKWVKATINYPLITGDRVWAGDNSFLELQLNNTVVRMGNQTSVKMLNISRKITQLQLSSGTSIIKVRQINPGQLLEISTPNLAFTIGKPGLYRLFVNPKSKTTTVAVLQGAGKVFASRNAYQMYSGKLCTFSANARLPRCTHLPTPDAFDRMSRARDPIVSRPSTRYVSSEMIGNEDLDRYGRWQATAQYGNVWIPEAVDVSWAPYRNGQWVWVRSWGWTWVDAQPWGFAPFHYGRWVYFRGRWVWAPGTRYVEPVYAPALVVFVGGGNYNLRLATGISGIGWIPLAPGEIYIPSRRVSREYFVNVNRGTRVTTTQINTNYNAYIHNTISTTNIHYQNTNVPNGVTAVTTTAFQQSESVQKALQPVSKEIISEAPKNPVATIVPDNTSATGAAPAAQTEPPKDVMNQPAIVTTTPPPTPLPFSEEQKLLEKDPGIPLTTEATEALQAPKIEDGKKADASAETQMELVNPDQAVKPIDPTTMDISKPEEHIKPEEQIKPQEETKPQEQIQPEQEPEIQVNPEENQAEEPRKSLEAPQEEQIQPEIQIQPEPEEKVQPQEQGRPEEQVQPEVQQQPEMQQQPQPQQVEPEMQQPQQEEQPQPEPQQVQPEAQPQPEMPPQ